MNQVKCKVVMFSTEKATENGIVKMDLGNLIQAKRKNLGNKIFDAGVEHSVYAGAYQPQHLYIISNEDIKEGDYFFNNYQEEVYKCLGIEHEETLKNTKEYGWKKIIATTDNSLNLPRPSDKFITAYCKANGKDFENVLVEYNTFSRVDSLDNYFLDNIIINNQEIFTTIDCDAEYDLSDKLKVSPDNTITIKPIKKDYSREEVEKLLELAWATASAYGENTNEADCKSWIEHNLI